MPKTVERETKTVFNIHDKNALFEEDENDLFTGTFPKWVITFLMVFSSISLGFILDSNRIQMVWMFAASVISHIANSLQFTLINLSTFLIFDLSICVLQFSAFWFLWSTTHAGFFRLLMQCRYLKPQLPINY